MKKALLPVLLFLFFIHISGAQGTTEGGNVSEINFTANVTTLYWAGIVGWMDNSSANPAFPISYLPIDSGDIYTNYPNGSYYNISMIVTRLPEKPSLTDIQTPTQADFDTGGMFSNFSVFAGLNFSLFTDSPLNTFCSPCNLMTCRVGALTFSCPYITLLNDTRVAVLKFDNGTWEEPIFLTVIESKLGYNGSYFDFEYMVPKSGNYSFFVYTEEAPDVTITSPQPTTYTTNTIPFTYTIVTYSAPLGSCWYVLDGTTVQMPDCTISYVLNVGDGTHTLTLYANDSEGNTGYGTVVFTVRDAQPPGPSGGPGAPHVGRLAPVIPPAYGQFEIRPENIRITIEYPLEGSANFSLYSLNELVDAYCFVRGDFENYTTIRLESDSIPTGGTIGGTISVYMPLTDIPDYSGKNEGLLQCIGEREANSTLLLSTSANVYLTINKPAIAVENMTIELLRGEEKAVNLTLTNIGNGSAYAYNLSVEFGGPYGNLFRLVQAPEILYNGESGLLRFFVSIPRDVEPGIYRIPILVYTNGRLVGQGYLTLFVREEVFIHRCIFPDLGWTVIILVAGVLAAIIIPGKTKRRGRTPCLYASGAALLFFVLWVLAVWILARCTYI